MGLKDRGLTSRTNSFKRENSTSTHQNSAKIHRSAKMERSLSFNNWEIVNESETDSDFEVLETKKSTPPNTFIGRNCERIQIEVPTITSPDPFVFFSPKPACELDAAATTVQKIYKSYRTRRNLADCAIVVEELWWKIQEVASQKKHNTVNGRNCERIQIVKPTITLPEPFLFP